MPTPYPMSDLPYAALHQTYPTLPYIGPTLCHPTSDLPYIRPILHWTYPTPPYVRPTLHRPVSDLPYTTLHQTCPMPVTYSMLPYARPTLCCPMWVTVPYTNNLPNSKDLLNSKFLVCLWVISGCDPSAPLLNPQVHERFLLRMVPHSEFYELVEHCVKATSKQAWIFAFRLFWPLLLI